MPDLFDNYSHPRPDSKPIVYAFSDIRYPGMFKIGYTTRSIETRMKEHFPTLIPGQSFKVELIESAMYSDGENFLDHDVHKVLEHKGFQKIRDYEDKKTEWFKCSLNDVKSAIIAVKTHTLNEENRTQTFKMRPEQVRAVEMTKAYFEQSKETKSSLAPKFLWNAKMRFGKTFASYKLAKVMEMKKVLILTFKPAVEDAWETDLKSHVDFENWQFYSRKTELYDGITPDKLDSTKPIVCFGSFQDFLGTNETGGIKAKNEWVHTTNWDLVIFDEYHFGAWRENAKKLFQFEDEDTFDELDLEEYKSKEADNAYNETFLPITTSFYLFLSGTPFRALNSGEFIEEQIFNWTYQDEQKAKLNWDESHGPNPYIALPKMILMTYKMPDEIRNIALNTENNEFDLNVFFSAESKKADKSDAQFVYKTYVQKWLNLIRGADWDAIVDDFKIKDQEKPVMPYSDTRMLNNLTHTLWFMPNVASCFAMKNLFMEKQNIFYQDYHINVTAGPSAGNGLDALKPVQDSMEDPLKSKTITLSCGKLTTGVTIRPWTAIFMLRSLSSPETYFQASFRIQSPWTIKNVDGSEEILKKECYIFDYALDRALRQISDYSCRLNINESNPENKVAEFINFLPVIAYDGSSMKEVNAIEILDMTTAGTSATLLARRWQSALLVNVDNETLQRLMDNDSAMKSLLSIEGFRNLNDDIKTIINKSNAVKKAKAEGNEQTPKEKEDLTASEREYKSKRKEIRDKLIKFATRVPIFMFLTDYREHSLKDVITQLEPGLFKKVTGLNVNDFELLVSLGVFNDSLMNDAVYKFKRYEDSSLEYTGISMHSKDKGVGLFSTSISKDEYEAMKTSYLGLEEQTAGSMYSDIAVVNTSPTVSIPPVVKTISQPKEATFSQPDSRAVIINKKPVPTKSQPIKLNRGDKVEHKVFGIGRVLEINGEKFTVDFSDSSKVFANPFAFDGGFIKKI